MMIEHVAMYVNNLEAARDFFVEYLGGKSKHIAEPVISVHKL